MRPEDAGRGIRAAMQNRVNRDRPQKATVVDVSNRLTTGEIECTLADNRTIYVDAANFYDLGVSDEIWVRQLNLGVRAQYLMEGFYRGASGSHVPGVWAPTGGSIDSILTDDSGNMLQDDSYNFLTEG